MNGTDKIFLLVFLLLAAFLLYGIIGAMPDFSAKALFSYLIRVNDDGSWKTGILLQGLVNTLRISFWCLLVAFLTGTFVGVASAHKKGISALPSTVYVLVLRNMPPLILLFLVFFFASSLLTEPLLNFEFMLSKSDCKELFYLLVAPEGQLDRVLACILTLGLYEGAYIAEIIRAGIESVPCGQWEAGRATGLTSWQIRRFIIAPQAMRQSLAPLTGQSISTVKDSAIASIISLQELTFQSMELMNVTGKTVELWILTALLYFCLCFCLDKLSRKFENTMQWKPLH